MMDALLLARMQFAANITFHILFPTISIGMGWLLLFFRLRSVLLSLILGIPYAAMAIVLFVCLLQLDRVAAWTLSPYLVYLCYANYWGYKLWKLNRDDDRGIAYLAAAWRGNR